MSLELQNIAAYAYQDVHVWSTLWPLVQQAAKSLPLPLGSLQEHFWFGCIGKGQPPAPTTG